MEEQGHLLDKKHSNLKPGSLGIFGQGLARAGRAVRASTPWGAEWAEGGEKLAASLWSIETADWRQESPVRLERGVEIWNPRLTLILPVASGSASHRPVLLLFLAHTARTEGEGSSVSKWERMNHCLPVLAGLGFFLGYTPTTHYTTPKPL